MNIKSINIQREISNSDFNSLRKWKLVKSTKTIIFYHISKYRIHISTDWTLYKVILHPLLEYNKLENKFSKLASNPQKPKRSKRKIVHNNPRLHNFIPRKLKNRVSSRPTYKGSFISGITSVVYDVIQGTKLSNRGHSAEQSAARMHTEVAMKPNTEI